MEAWTLERLPIGDPGVHLLYTAAILAITFGVVAVLHRRRWYVAL